MNADENLFNEILCKNPISVLVDKSQFIVAPVNEKRLIINSAMLKNKLELKII